MYLYLAFRKTDGTNGNENVQPIEKVKSYLGHVSLSDHARLCSDEAHHCGKRSMLDAFFTPTAFRLSQSAWIIVALSRSEATRLTISVQATRLVVPSS